MKFRSDFVTNSSSASYTLAFRFTAADGKNMRVFFPEELELEEGWHAFYGPELSFSEELTRTIAGKAESGARIGEICDYLVENIQSDFENDISPLDFYKNILNDFKNRAAETGIEATELSDIAIENIKLGYGESAMFTEFEKLFGEMMAEYENSNNIGKEAIIKKAFEYLNLRPKIAVEDNAGVLDEAEVFEWEGDDKKLLVALKKIFEKKYPVARPAKAKRDWWMLESVTRSTLDVHTGEVKKEVVVKIGEEL